MKKFYHLRVNKLESNMKALKNLPFGVQDFESLRNDGYLYVDKTALVYQLATTGRYYLLSRPRRFGKSMLLSTLHAYFTGKKELFEGLAIENLEKDWIKHPVLHLDLNTVESLKFDYLKYHLNDTFSEYEEIYGKSSEEKTLDERFAGIIRRAYEKTGQRVVILVDEYDKIMVNDAKIANTFEPLKSILKPIFDVLTTMKQYIRFAFITGVTKFSKQLIFEDVEIQDISLDAAYSAVCGFTDEEIKSLLQEIYKNSLSDKSINSFYERIQRYYSGYNFGCNALTVFNPKEITLALRNDDTRWWGCEIVNPYREKAISDIYGSRIDNLENIWVSPNVLDCSGDRDTYMMSLFYSYGYLSVKGFDEHRQLYHLYFPNNDIKNYFLSGLLAKYIQNNRQFELFVNLTEDIKSGNIEDYFVQLKKLFSYAIENQPTLLNLQYDVIYLVTKLMGLYVKAEYHTSEGRIDLVLQTDKYIYVMEFKLNDTAEEALQQINDKNYTLPFAVDNRKVIKVGVNFSSKTRNIDRWILE
jgi:hypothetical protein